MIFRIQLRVQNTKTLAYYLRQLLKIVYMTIQEAAQHLFHDNEQFDRLSQEYDREGAKLRASRNKFNRGELGTLAIIRLLERFKYTISVNHPEL